MNLAPPLADDNSSACKVLTDEGLLGKLLSHIHCPACFVRAALTSKLWFRNASSQATIRDFRSRQSPHLLGIYVTSDGFWKPDFVPLVDALCPELAAALRHGNFGFDGIDASPLRVWDCRGHRVLYGSGDIFGADLVLAVRTPLRRPGEDTAMFLPPPPTIWNQCPHAMLLPDDADDEVSCYSVNMADAGQTVFAKVYALQAGSWTTRCTAVADVGRPSATIPRMTLIMSGKIYMLASAGYILVLDLAARAFFTVDLPEGVVINLVHLNEDMLTVWYRKMGDHGGAGNWVLKDTISVRGACEHLVDGVWGPEEGQQDAVAVVGAGDNAEFVFLEFIETRVFVSIHVDSREAKVVYQRDPDNDFILRVHPFMMDWPPVFRELGAGAGAGAGVGEGTG